MFRGHCLTRHALPRVAPALLAHAWEGGSFSTRGREEEAESGLLGIISGCLSIRVITFGVPGRGKKKKKENERKKEKKGLPGISQVLSATAVILPYPAMQARAVSPHPGQLLDPSAMPHRTHPTTEALGKAFGRWWVRARDCQNFGLGHMGKARWWCEEASPRLEVLRPLESFARPELGTQIWHGLRERRGAADLSYV